MFKPIILNTSKLLTVKLGLYILLFSLPCCSKISSISRNHKVEDWNVEYSLLGNIPKQHSPYTILVNARNGANQSLYWFFANTDFVQKSKGLRNRGVTDYYLIYDSSYRYKMNKWDSLSLKKSSETNGELVPLNKLDLEVFNKIIFYSDSLKLRSFHHLKKAQTFKVVVTKK